jgi:hypothetical protein
MTGTMKHSTGQLENPTNEFSNSISNAYDVASQGTGHSMYDRTLVDNDLDAWDSDEPTQTERQTLRKVWVP